MSRSDRALLFTCIGFLVTSGCAHLRGTPVDMTDADLPPIPPEWVVPGAQLVKTAEASLGILPEGAWEGKQDGNLTFGAGGRVACIETRRSLLDRILRSIRFEQTRRALHQISGHVWLDGSLDPAYDAVGGLTFSRDGKHFAYGAREGPREHYGVDGLRSQSYDAVGAATFMPDGRFVYVASLDRALYLVREDAEQWLPFSGGYVTALQASADGTRLAYVASDSDDGWYVVVDDVGAGPYKTVLAPVFSADGSRVAYAAARDGSWFLVLDGQESASRYDLVSEPVFSPDGQRVAYWAARERRELLVLDGKEIGEYDLHGEILPPAPHLPPSAIYHSSRWPRSPIAFSPDGKRFAYAAKRDGRTVFRCEDVERVHEDADPLSLSFSPDGSRIAYAFQERRGFWSGEPIGTVHLVVDGVEVDTGGGALWVHRSAAYLPSSTWMDVSSLGSGRPLATGSSGGAACSSS